VRSRRTALVGGLALALATFAQAAPNKGDLIDIGPAVGARIPTLAATDSTGQPRTLDNLVGRKGLVLVFFRSARWCPFCQRQLLDLRNVQADLEKRGYVLAAISYDQPDQLAAFAKKWEIRYVLLSDPKSAMIDAFNIRDPQYPPGSFAFGVPKPAIFVVDRHGMVRAKVAREGYEIRPSDAEILTTADRAG
jgi:peroxiredoxin